MVCSFVEWTVESPHGVRMRLLLDAASGVGIDICAILPPISLLIQMGLVVFLFLLFKCFLSIVTLSFYHFVILLFCLFLVACYATLHPAMSVGRSIGWSVGWSVGRLVGRSVSPLLTFSAFLRFLSIRLLP